MNARTTPEKRETTPEGMVSIIEEDKTLQISQQAADDLTRAGMIFPCEICPCYHIEPGVSWNEIETAIHLFNYKVTNEPAQTAM